MKLLIVESPNKKKTIAKYLGSGWNIEASMGHVCDLPQKELGVSVPDYKPIYELTERGKITIKRLQEAAKKAESVWLAMDPDREGEAIAGHIARYLKHDANEFHRIVFHEITPKAVQAAVANPRALDRALFYAQQARRVIDRLVGYQVSPRLSHLANQNLSAGRVQSVALRLLVEREREIKRFKPTEHFGVRLHFVNDSIKWFADWNTQPFVTDDFPYVQDQELVDKVAAIQEVAVLKVEKRTSQRKAPPPFITTTLQKAASIQLGINAEDTMRLAQLLFEKGFITYHRTDNPNLSQEAIQEIQQELIKLNFVEHIAKPANRWKAKEGAQEAHEAIRPTRIDLVETGLLGNTQKLYELIRLRALASQMASAQIETIKIVLISLDEKQSIKGITPQFIAKGTKTLYAGWRLLINQDLAEEKERDESLQGKLPELKAKDMLVSKQSEILALKTQAPKRYIEASLITTLEKQGIGRPSTYAAILSNIKLRGYVKLNGKTFEALPPAEIIVDALMGKFQFMEVSYTREMENALDGIAEGKKEYLTVVEEADRALQRGLGKLGIESFLENNKSCPRCQAPMRKIKGKNGLFWGCTRYQEGCKETLAVEQNGSADSHSQTSNEKVPNQYICPQCNRLLQRIKGKKGFFWGCSGYSMGCKLTLDNKRGKPAKYYSCPKCKWALRQSKSSLYWICSGYKEGCHERFENKGSKPQVEVGVK